MTTPTWESLKLLALLLTLLLALPCGYGLRYYTSQDPTQALNAAGTALTLTSTFLVLVILNSKHRA